MLLFVARRLLYLIPVLIAVSLLTFFIASLPPDKPEVQKTSWSSRQEPETSATGKLAVERGMSPVDGEQRAGPRLVTQGVRRCERALSRGSDRA